MTAFFFKGIPGYYMNRFSTVRDTFDNLHNVLNIAEIANTCAHCMADASDDDFDLVIFSGDFNRALVKKNNGYFSMAIPFQVIKYGDRIAFNCDYAQEEVSGMFISVMRNALLAAKDGDFYYDSIVCSISDAFDLSVCDASRYSDSFVTLLADDHGYFRFDDDPVNQRGDYHPRYHFDFFYKNASTVKIGSEDLVGIECFYSFFDESIPKRYLRR